MGGAVRKFRQNIAILPKCDTWETAAFGGGVSFGCCTFPSPGATATNPHFPLPPLISAGLAASDISSYCGCCSKSQPASLTTPPGSLALEEEAKVVRVAILARKKLQESF